jgi:5-formaminoimidazole-4-carboxamide-1-beta-D-ribofuranosyl 5'-monophosphate synthetase
MLPAALPAIGYSDLPKYFTYLDHPDMLGMFIINQLVTNNVNLVVFVLCPRPLGRIH